MLIINDVIGYHSLNGGIVLPAVIYFVSHYISGTYPKASGKLAVTD